MFTDDYRGFDEKSRKTRQRSVTPQAQRTPAPTPSSDIGEQESDMTSPEYMDDAEEIIITAVMDTHGHLIELMFNRCHEIPSSLISVIGFCIPFHRHLYRLTVRWGPLTSLGLYEFSKILYASQLTEMYLDDSPVAGRNYEMLLDRPSTLRCLSLARCKLDDADCAKIAALLAHPRPASKTINVLNLMSNRIGDKGACTFAHVLRSNRSLHYLNLSGNHITDLGAVSIFNSLMEFPLAYDELFGKRSRHFEYLRHRNEVFARCVKELLADRSHDEVRQTRRRTTIRAHKKISLGGLSTSDAIHLKADAMTTELVGIFADPFGREQTQIRDGQVYCNGNLTLNCLNLCYNNLEYPSIVSLYDVLIHQSFLVTKVNATGLLHVGIEGNNLPVDCDELVLIDELLERAQLVKTKNIKRGSERIKARTSRLH